MKFLFKVSPSHQSTVLKLLTNDWIVLDQLCQLKSVAQFRQSKYNVLPCMYERTWMYNTHIDSPKYKVKVDNQVFKLGGWIGTEPYSCMIHVS